MRSFTHFLENVGNTLNPIVIKELRQAVQGKFLAAVLLLFLGVQLLTVGLFLMDDSVSWSFNAGRNIFRTLSSMLMGTCLILVPAYTGLRLAIERSDANVDLLFITTLHPRSIIWGKFFAALVFTALLYGACMPFITLTFLLRGIDLPSIFVLLVLNFIVIAVAIQSSILVGCLPANRVFKIIIGLVWFLIMTSAVPVYITLTVAPGMGILDSGIGSRVGSWHFFAVSMGVLVSGVAFIGLFANLATALISPLSANRAMPARIYISVVWIVTGLGVTIWSVQASNIAPIGVWASVQIVLQCVGLLVAVSERESVGNRVRQSIPRRRLLRPPAFLFFSGAGGGVAWSSLMIILTLLFVAVWSSAYPHLWGGNEYEEFMVCMSALGMFALSYALAASFIRRRILVKRIAGCHTWLIALIMMASATTIIPLMLFFLSGTWANGWFIGSPLSPFISIANGDDELLEASALLAGAFAVFIGSLNLPWFVKQVINFQPPRGRNSANPLTE
ncbi:MAG: hypothetical protein OXN17_12670 [Candidatus Poribacteria bacterium]|nr:hypothetical protein [Candidatus Poribacteria bacterium]MDE0506194.1 hypothetical protein [Candidatus Poribacteria bacterium]